jgi:hypothetical protein
MTLMAGVVRDAGTVDNHDARRARDIPQALRGGDDLPAGPQ